LIKVSVLQKCVKHLYRLEEKPEVERGEYLTEAVFPPPVSVKNAILLFAFKNMARGINVSAIWLEVHSV
jgi:hypothetical protein